jgi:uncharacterized protein (TIGR00251 family)
VPGPWYCWHDRALVLRLRVQPRANRDEIAGQHGNRLKIRLRAPPVDRKANESLIRFVAELCGVTKADVEIISGTSGRDKRVRVDAPRSLPDGVKPTGSRPG